jgi:hypothetical protein
MKAGYGKAGKQKTLSNFPTATTTTNYNYLWDTDSEGKVISSHLNGQNCIETIEPGADSNHLYGGTRMKANMNGDLDDISMAYFWYPFLAIVTMVVAAVAVVIKMV